MNAPNHVKCRALHCVRKGGVHFGQFGGRFAGGERRRHCAADFVAFGKALRIESGVGRTVLLGQVSVVVGQRLESVERKAGHANQRPRSETALQKIKRA